MLLSLIIHLPEYSAGVLLCIKRYMDERSHDIVVVNFTTRTASKLVVSGLDVKYQPLDYAACVQRYYRDEHVNAFFPVRDENSGVVLVFAKEPNRV